MISGFTFIRNAVTYDFPIVESITSILPICDEYVVCIGKSDDDTVSLIESIGSGKIKIIKSVWDDSLREGGRVFAIETDKALAHVSPESTWAFYLQGDEVVHEKYLDTIVAETDRYKSDERVEGLLFDYKHFYGTYDYVADARSWYRREIRIIRNGWGIHSWGDAQGFRKDGRKLAVKSIPATIYHYGWVKSQKVQTEKMRNNARYWHDDTYTEQHFPADELIDYSKVQSLTRFVDTHPFVMHGRVKSVTWTFDVDERRRKLSLKDRVLMFIERLTGKRLFEYRNYKLI